jgi:DNA polymerase-3 subunit delta
VFLVVGDPVLSEPRSREILDRLVPPDRRDLDLEVVRAGEDSLARVDASLAQVGMFGGGRTVWLRNLGAESAAETEALLDLLARGLPEGAALVMTAVRIDARSRLYKWLAANAVVENLSMETDRRGRLRDEDVDAFVRDRIVAEGLASPAPAVVSLVRERAGSEIGALAHEIDKLCLACAAAGRVTPQDVRTHVRDGAGAWVFDLTNAISDRRPERAASLVSRLLDQGEPPIRLVAVLAGHVADLIEAARATRHVPAPALRNAGAFARDYFPKLPEEVRNRFKSGFRAYYVFQGASAYGFDELRRLHRALVEADLALKSTRTDPRHLLVEIVERACASGAH